MGVNCVKLLVNFERISFRIDTSTQVHPVESEYKYKTNLCIGIYMHVHINLFVLVYPNETMESIHSERPRWKGGVKSEKTHTNVIFIHHS